MSASEKFKEEFKKGREAEERFIAECEKNDIPYKKTSPQEDMNDHVDIIITLKDKRDYKVDVKGLKKISRRDSSYQEDFHIIEIKNVLGGKGWAFGEADLFAFETLDYWMIVRKKDLHKLIKEKAKKEYASSVNEALYKLYTRPGRNDLITMVKSLDLMGIACKRLKKTFKDETLKVS